MDSENSLIVAQAANGDEGAFAELCRRYEPLILSMSRKYARMSGTTDETQAIEDFSQEAALALYRAAVSYNCGMKEVTFGLYAKICIRNALVSELRRMGKKRKAELEKSDGMDFHHDAVPMDEAMLELISEKVFMSEFEKKVFEMYISGSKIREIASALGRSSKSVSNAVYRIKEKIRLSLDSAE